MFCHTDQSTHPIYLPHTIPCIQLSSRTSVTPQSKSPTAASNFVHDGEVWDDTNEVREESFKLRLLGDCSV